MPWTWVQSLVRELRSLKLRGTAGKKRKEKKFRKPEQNPEVTSINFNGLLSPFFPLQACIELFFNESGLSCELFCGQLFPDHVLKCFSVPGILCGHALRMHLP